MNESRSYASLSSGLLARKGAAKPAMRPQAYTGFEDLGWNDMGDPAYDPRSADEPHPAPVPPEHVPSSISALTPAPRSRSTLPEEAPEDAALEGHVPSVAAQQRAILESFDHEEEPAAPAEVPASRPAKAQVLPMPKRAAGTAGKKVAFTLRLDAERHLRLRLACAVTGRSAQQLVSAALEAHLASIPELDALAERVPARAAIHGN